MKKNKYGQYFTPEMVAYFMVMLANVSAKTRVLEPSAGEGVFVKCLREHKCKDIIPYEIDSSIIGAYKDIAICGSFISAQIEKKFDVVIGNPPYIRWKNLEDELKKELETCELWNKYCNSLCDYLHIFIIKSIELLEDGGCLVFICPEYWMNTTHSITLRNYMVSNGYFSDIYHFSETPIFKGVATSSVIFKYIKTTKKPSSKINVAMYESKESLTTEILDNLLKCRAMPNVEYLKLNQFKENNRWMLVNEDTAERLKTIERACSFNADLFETKMNRIGDVCDIGNGMVSGLDKAFQIDYNSLNAAERKATLNVVKAKDLQPYRYVKKTTYINVPSNIIEESNIISDYPNFYSHLANYKADLEKRYSYGKDLKYWHWAFRRSESLFAKKEPRIFVPCKERISNKDYFRFALVPQGIFPTQDVTALFLFKTTKECIEYILAWLNSPFVFEWVKVNGIVKGNIVEFSEKPLSSIPFLSINFNDVVEVKLYNEVTDLSKEAIKGNYTPKINDLFNLLITHKRKANEIPNQLSESA